MPCPECGCTNPGCENGCKLTKLDEIHAWLAEIMPTFRRAAKLMDNSVAVRIRESMKRR